MKAITVVTLIFLPATFLSVGPVPPSGIRRLPFLDILQHGVLQIRSGKVRVLPSRLDLFRLYHSAHLFCPRGVIRMDRVDKEEARKAIRLPRLLCCSDACPNSRYVEVRSGSWKQGCLTWIHSGSKVACHMPYRFLTYLYPVYVLFAFQFGTC